MFEYTKQQILNHFKKNNLELIGLKICLIIKKLMMKNFKNQILKLTKEYVCKYG